MPCHCEDNVVFSPFMVTLDLSLYCHWGFVKVASTDRYSFHFMRAPTEYDNALLCGEQAGEQQLREQRQNHQELRRERQKQVDASWND